MWRVAVLVGLLFGVPLTAQEWQGWPGESEWRGPDLTPQVDSWTRGRSLVVEELETGEVYTVVEAPNERGEPGVWIEASPGEGTKRGARIRWLRTAWPGDVASIGLAAAGLAGTEATATLALRHGALVLVVEPAMGEPIILDLLGAAAGSAEAPENLPVLCFEPLNFGGSTAGWWSIGLSCGSHFRGDETTAVYYRFTITQTRTVFISLSGDTDPMLFLSEGGGGDGFLLESDDDDGPGVDAYIERVLAPGTYTIEATTYWPGREGNFTLSVRQSGSGPVGNATVRWTIADGCSDNRGFSVRFFDRTRGRAYPSRTSVYRVPVGTTRTFQFLAARGSEVCLGARQNPATNLYWCTDVDGLRPPSQSSCCARVPSSGSLVRSNSLVCP